MYWALMLTIPPFMSGILAGDGFHADEVQPHGSNLSRGLLWDQSSLPIPQDQSAGFQAMSSLPALVPIMAMSSVLI